MKFDTIVGIDIGRVHDHTVVVVLNRWCVTLVEQLPLNLEFKDIVDHLKQYIEHADCVMVDASGVGSPIAEQLKHEHAEKVIGVQITGGESVRTGPYIWHVSKSVLANTLQQAFERGKLKIRCPEPGLSVLRHELSAFDMKPGKRPKWGAKPGHHDDAVLALALALLPRIVGTTLGIVHPCDEA